MSRSRTIGARTDPEDAKGATQGALGRNGCDCDYAALTDLVMPGMFEAGWGRIIVVASIFGLESGGAPAYSVAKAAEI